MCWIVQMFKMEFMLDLCCFSSVFAICYSCNFQHQSYLDLIVWALRRCVHISFGWMVVNVQVLFCVVQRRLSVCSMFAGVFASSSFVL